MVQKREKKLFQGMKAQKINKFVLMALFENGYLTSFEIANKIAVLDPMRAKKNRYQEAQKINSVLCRTNGRLFDLCSKGFIQKSEKRYYLTLNKGFCTALLCYDKTIPTPAIEAPINTLTVFPELAKFLELVKKYSPDFEQGNQTEMLNFREITQRILDKGFDLDNLSNQEFNTYFMDEQETFYLSKNRTSQNKDAKTPNFMSIPEVNEAFTAFMNAYTEKIKKIFEKTMFELNSSIENIKNSTLKENQSGGKDEPNK